MPGRATICIMNHGTAAPTDIANGSCENGATTIRTTASAKNTRFREFMSSTRAGAVATARGKE